MPHTSPQSTASQSSRPKAKSILAVRMLIARTAWLDGRHYWRDGNVSWEMAGEAIVPEASDISRAQRHLNRIEGFPNAARIALGDSQAWLSQRRSRLELAKFLRALPKTEIIVLAQQARQRDSSVAAELTRLLAAEALCLNGLPESPSAALTTLGPPAVPHLIALLRDAQTPPAACALSALTLGAIRRNLDAAEAKLLDADLLPTRSDVWQSRAFAWGRSKGLPAHPAFVTTLLAESDEIAERGQRSVEGSGFLTLSVPMLRELLAEGLPSVTVIELAEAAREAETIAERMLNVRSLLPDPQRQWDRRKVSEALRAERGQAVQALADAVTTYARSSHDPQVLRLITSFFRQMLGLTQYLAPSSEATAAVLSEALELTKMGLKLPPARHRDYWELLTEQHLSFWNTTALQPGQTPHREVSKLRSWLHDARTKHLAPLCRLLTAAQNKKTVAAIFDLGAQQILAKQTWDDPELYRLFVTLAADLELKGTDYFVWELCQVLDAFPNAREARPYFQAFFQPLRAFPPALRRHVFENLLDEAGRTRHAVRQHLPRVILLLPTLARFAAHKNDEQCSCGPVCEAALALSQTAPDQAQAHLDQMLSVVPASKWQARNYAGITSLRTGLMLAVSLAAGYPGHFEDSIRTATQHHFRQEWEQIKKSLRLLEGHPTLRRPLAQIFARQPQRVADLLVRLGLTTRLSTDIQPLLACLEPQAPQNAAPGTVFPVFVHPNQDWWTLHKRLPDLTLTANAYRHAQWIRGETQDIPAGVIKVLNRPQKIAAELTHLEGILATDPARAGIYARVSKLRALLEDGPRLAEEIGAEVQERLPQIVTEAQAAAIEHQVLACYRTRLEAVAGPVPPGLVLTEDLINATLLTVDITQNRKLLLHLLRAHLAGDLDWREKHPANQTFLAGLKNQGAVPEVWLSEFPRRYACEGAQGGKVHLRLERDPLHILQMGNHFDTCLSFGGINAFSTVANASELNKRVIYARDASGHVVGRKLIGISAEGKLVGFHSYCSLSEETSNQSLRNVFRQYATLFADRCGVEMADDGTVPTLFAEAWYDDYAEAWDEDAAKSKPDPTTIGKGGF